jgi:hypothetical protein
LVLGRIVTAVATTARSVSCAAGSTLWVAACVAVRGANVVAEPGALAGSGPELTV